jgi:hypothetical protein
MRRAVLITALASGAFAAEPSVPPPNDYPEYVSQLPNPNDYSLFANGGWDGNWYVGYNTCWIKKLPRIPTGDYTRAYIGAKLGRMKLSGNPKNAWDKYPVPGSIYIALSSTPAWAKDTHQQLITTEDIPLEGDYESAVEGTGEAQWFWVEVPLEAVSFSGDNYLALWSPTPALVSVSSSPLLAAGWGGKDQNTWLLRDVRGVPPRTPASFGTPITYFEPAMALKLIPRGPVHPMTVQIVNWTPGLPERPKPVVTARIQGDSISSAWLEHGDGSRPWVKISRPLWKAPYILTVDPAKLPPGRVQLRVAVRNIWEEHGVSAPFTVDVSTSLTKPGS